MFTLIALVFLGCNKDNELKNQSEELSDADYKVMSTVLADYIQRIGGPNWKKRDTLFNKITKSTDSLNMIVIDDSTTNGTYGTFRINNLVRIKSIDSASDLKEKLSLVNAKCCKIDGSKITSVKTHVVTPEEFRRIFKENDYDYFYKTFPDAFGMFTISRPVYSKDFSQGLIYIGLYRNSGWGRGDFIYIKQTEDKWVIDKIEQIWKK